MGCSDLQCLCHKGIIFICNSCFQFRLVLRVENGTSHTTQKGWYPDLTPTDKPHVFPTTCMIKMQIAHCSSTPQ